MKAVAYSLLATTGLLAFTGSSAIEVGERAPPVVVTIGSDPLDLTEFTGKYLYVDFWASWCGPCLRSFPWMNELNAKYADKGLVIVGVNLDTKRKDAEQFLARVPATFHIAFDPKAELATQFGVQAMPTSFLIGPDGNVVLTHAGFREDERSVMEAKLAALLGSH